MTETMAKRLSVEQIAWRVAQDIQDGSYVNLGIGLPERVAEHLPGDREIVFHSENGILGMGPTPNQGEEDYDLINAGKKPVTLRAGGAFFHHADSFAMIRGGHLDVCVLGAFQVAANGDLANWTTGEPGAAPAVGGAMDLAVGAKRVFVMTTHVTKAGAPKLVERCSYPLTGVGCVTTAYTDLAVVDIDGDGFVARELAPGVEPDELERLTGAPIRLAPGWRRIAPPF